MGVLYLPPDLAQERDEINADRKAQLLGEYAEHWTAELRRLDPTLRVGRASENATDPDLIPGKWYLEKEIPGSVNEYLQLPRPPGAWLFDWLTAADLWNPRVHRSRKEAKEKFREAKVRARALEAEQRRDHMAEGFRAASRMKGPSGMHRRNDLKLPPAIAAERKKAIEAAP